MTDNDKALVERLRFELRDWDGASRFHFPEVNALVISQTADHIEAQAAEIERLRGIVALWLDLATGPDEMGDYYRQKQAIKASQEALERRNDTDIDYFVQCCGAYLWIPNWEDDP